MDTPLPDNAFLVRELLDLGHRRHRRHLDCGQHDAFREGFGVRIRVCLAAMHYSELDVALFLRPKPPIRQAQADFKRAYAFHDHLLRCCGRVGEHDSQRAS